MLNAATTPPSDGRPQRLLVVDDDPLQRHMATRTLRHAGFDVSEAADGEAALALLAEVPVDLLLLDLLMPGLDGYAVCRRVRALPQGGLLPILVLTGLNDTSAIDAAYEAGATDFIAKPIHWTLLSHRVRYALRAAAAAASAQRAITDRIAAERRIVQLAHYDGLTGLPNGRLFRDLCLPALERSARLGSACALLQVDIDRFKDVNDAMGRTDGDAVLRLVAERLTGAVRTSDLLGAPRGGNASVVARVGANAFNLLLVDVGDTRATALVADRVLQRLSAPLVVDGRELVLTASVGIAMFPRDAGDADGLARCAEQALYTAKAAGRGQHRFFDEATNRAASLRLAREGELRRAIAQGELRLHYQPKVDAGSGAIIGAEALVRWQHAQRGLVPPAEFVPLAEESGLIGPLTDWVLDAACGELRRQADAGLPLLPVSVNLAASSVADAGLPAQLDALLARHRLQPACLVLEVTESVLMSDVERAMQRLAALRAGGFLIALDDFGTGYSSLNYLNRFPVDELKIDRSFITDVALGGRHGAIAASIIALGRAFGLRVVAEGVEHAAQAEFLLAHGCARQQGFLHARPMPAEDYARRLAGLQPPAAPGMAGAGTAR